MDRNPKPNTLAISWSYGEYETGTLGLKPKYQRNPIWSIGQKCFLIDSILSGCPIPQVYINILTKKKEKGRQTIYEVVDGQQRLRAICEFLDEDWRLIETTARSYPVSDLYKVHIGKTYSELPDNLQEKVWNYPLSVQELRGWDATEIRALFRRLNYVVEKLNKQELRHSQYFGLFMEAVEKLAKDAFWDETGIFSRRDAQRMTDIEFISELFIVVVDGVQDQQKTLDKFYADYDVVFPRRLRYLRKFGHVLESLRTIMDLFENTRFKKKADFYGLFAAVCELHTGYSYAIDLSPAKAALAGLSKELGKTPDSLTGVYATYHTTVIEGPNKQAKRKLRSKILLDLLEANIKDE